MKTYKTFKRSATSFETFARARKITVDTGLTYEQAQRQCREWNENRTPSQIKAGTKLEFVEE